MLQLFSSARNDLEGGLYAEQGIEPQAERCCVDSRRCAGPQVMNSYPRESSYLALKTHIKVVISGNDSIDVNSVELFWW